MALVRGVGDRLGTLRVTSSSLSPTADGAAVKEVSCVYQKHQALPGDLVVGWILEFAWSSGLPVPGRPSALLELP